jgi:hypothetical protein
LKETAAPEGYVKTGNTLYLSVSFGELTLEMDGEEEVRKPIEADNVPALLANASEASNELPEEPQEEEPPEEEPEESSEEPTAEPTEESPPPHFPPATVTTPAPPSAPPPVESEDDISGGEETVPPPQPALPEPLPQQPQTAIPAPPPASGELVPQEDGSFIELDEEGVPLGTWTRDPETYEWIFEEFPPLGSFDIPKTGDAGIGAALALALISAACLLLAARPPARWGKR